MYKKRTLVGQNFHVTIIFYKEKMTLYHKVEGILFFLWIVKWNS